MEAMKKLARHVSHYINLALLWIFCVCGIWYAWAFGYPTWVNPPPHWVDRMTMACLCLAGARVMTWEMDK